MNPKKVGEKHTKACGKPYFTTMNQHHALMHELQCDRHKRPGGDAFLSQIVYQHIYS